MMHDDVQVEMIVAVEAFPIGRAMATDGPRGHRMTPTGASWPKRHKRSVQLKRRRRTTSVTRRGKTTGAWLTSPPSDHRLPGPAFTQQQNVANTMAGRPSVLQRGSQRRSV